ncbi:MAG TPA: lysophospholipid acyltransferase family protein [Caulifigura sp.]|jgi:lysophospholipid acyltransferase (LPLAT)-like uncharacterized protein|nr:lysophospholipid acyltransferase family protein [Caulifigura sp.]
MKIRSRFAIRLLGRLLAATARLYFMLVRTEIHLTQPLTSPYEKKAPAVYLYCLWHHSILCAIFCGRCDRLAGLASRHADGSFVADAMEAIGLRSIRGSNKRGGAAAMKEMLDATAELNIAIATDGPRGPHEVVKEGIIFLASHSGRPIIPTGVSANRAWKPWLKWTYLTIPKPFSRAVMVGGAPFRVPPDLSREEREVYRQKLQLEMDRLLEIAERIARGETVSLAMESSLQAEHQRVAA